MSASSSSSGSREPPEGSPGQQVSQRRRTEHRPYIGHSSLSQRYLNRLKEVQLADLTQKDNEIDDLDEKYLTVQLLRIIMPDADKVAMAKSKHSRPYNKQPVQVQYERMFLCRVISRINAESCKTVYFLEDKSNKHTYLQYYIRERDNGFFTIGCVFRLPAPSLVDNEVGSIPMIKCDHPIILCHPAEKLSEIPLTTSIRGNECMAFTLNGAIIASNKMTPEGTTCGGSFCDKQRVDVIKVMGSRCGCFNHNSRRSSVAISHCLTVTHPTLVGPIKHLNFSSTKFSRLYLDAMLGSHITTKDFFGKECLFDLKDASNAVIDEINDNDGWTVIGWYRRGLITDRALLGIVDAKYDNKEESQVDGEITSHIVSVQPTNRDYLNPETEEGKRLQDISFKTASLKNPSA